MQEERELVTAILIFVGLPAAFYFVLPQLIAQTLKFKVGPSIRPCEIDESPQVIRSFLEDADAQLKAIGFDRLGVFLVDDFVPNAIMVLGVYRHEQNEDLACSAFTTAVNNGLEGKLVNTLVEIQREFRIGDRTYEISTCDSADLGVFRILPDSVWFRLPGIGGLKELYEAHRAIAEDLIVDRRRVELLANEYDGDCIRYLRERTFDAISAGNAAYGLLSLRRNGAFYQPTFFGTYELTWREMPPIKQIRKWLVRRRGRALQAKLDAGLRITVDDATACGDEIRDALS